MTIEEEPQILGAPGVVSAERRPRVPDFFIVGHQKCGTTALYQMLREHPQIFMPRIKEPRFLASDLRDRFPAPKQVKLPTTPDQYLALFDAAGAEQRAGEASPIYLTSRSAAAEIARIQPAARVIAILREPASFLRSLHLQLVEKHVETERSFRRAIELEQARREGQRIPAQSHRPQILLYSEHVRYVEQLRRYHNVFPPEQILVLIYDDFRRDNEATVRRVLRFLDVDDAAPLAVADANPTVHVRAQRLYKIIHAVALSQDPLSRALKSTLRGLAPRSMRGATGVEIRNRLFYTSPGAPDEQFMLELRRRFKPEVDAISAYLKRDLTGLWGYDELA